MSKIKDNLKKSGYIENIPKNSNPHEYEKIIIKRNQKVEILYRHLSKRKSSDDKKYDFSESLEIYNSLI